jgi:hypothetical protein
MLSTSYTTEQMRTVYWGPRIIYLGHKAATFYNGQIEVNDYGTIHKIEDGLVYVYFDKGTCIPLAEEYDYFMCI